MDIGIDLGTANIVMTMGKRGVVLNEPSVIAFHKRTEQVVAIGRKAYAMIGRAPDYLAVVRPLKDGVISDDELTQCMIREFILKVSGKQLITPRIIICVPSFITDVERRAVMEAARSAGSRKVNLIQEPLAAMLGAGVSIGQANGHMVVDIGGGTTDIAVVSMNGIVTSHSIKVAGNRLDEAIIRYVSNKYKLMIGERTAEDAKIALANLYDPSGDVRLTVRGKNLMRGLPDSAELTEVEMFEALEEDVFSIIEAVRHVLEQTPPELIGDIYDNGILLTGGSSYLGGLEKLISRTLGVRCHVAKDAETCVAKGTAKAFRRRDVLLDGFESVTLFK